MSNNIDIFGTYSSDVHAAFFELVGTMLFLTFGLSGCQTAATVHARDTISLAPASSGPSVPELEYCAKTMGLSLFVWAVIFCRITGGVFNPAVAVALFATGSLSFVRFVLYVVAQLIGSIAAAFLIRVLHPSPTAVNTTVFPGVGNTRAVFVEAFVTFILVITVLITGTDSRFKASKILAPLTIGASLWLGHLWALEYTGSSMNPARSFGPSVSEGFKSDHWVYWLGPFIGSGMAIAFFTYLHQIQYWTFGNTDDPSEPDVDTTPKPTQLPPLPPIIPLSEKGKRPETPSSWSPTSFAPYHYPLPTYLHPLHTGGTYGLASTTTLVGDHKKKGTDEQDNKSSLPYALRSPDNNVTTSFNASSGAIKSFGTIQPMPVMIIGMDQVAGMGTGMGAGMVSMPSERVPGLSHRMAGGGQSSEHVNQNRV